MEKSDYVDQKTAAVRLLLTEQALIFSRQGSVQRSWRYYQGQKLGPFYRLVYREGGKQWSVYLGSDEKLADEVRHALQLMQAPLQRSREMDCHLALAKAALKEQKQALDHELQQRGLFRKGSEIRGWRGRTKVARPR